MPRTGAPVPDRRVVAELKARLDARRAEVAAEIRSYPPPIPACDQQYNHLLKQRKDLLRARLGLETLQAGGGPDALRAALRTSAFESDPELGADLNGLLP